MKPFRESIQDLEGYNEVIFLDWRWRVLESLYNKNWEVRGKGKIPQIVHQVWVGDKDFPESYKFWADSWRKYNPEYEYILWDNEKVKELTLPEIYYQIDNPGPKSDILRYNILNKFGGIYVDTDFECLKSFDDLSGFDFYTSLGYQWRDWDRVEMYPGLIACVPGHPIMKKLAEEINKLTLEEYKNKSVHTSTSSYFFTRVFFEVVRNYQKGIVVTPPDIFYPFPNGKGYETQVARRFVKYYSYAVHHWEVSWCKKKESNYIQGEKFVGIADSVYCPKNRASDDYAGYLNTFDPSNLNPINVVYTNVMYLVQLLDLVSYFPNKFVIISHNGDQHIDYGEVGTYNNGKRISGESFIIPDNVIKIYCTNVNINHFKIECIPLGLENSMWKSTKKEVITHLRTLNLPKSKLCYMNHDIKTNKEERNLVYNMFCDRSWVTNGKYLGNRIGYDVYYRELASHKFVLNPPGNGLDNHRMWEAWYLGTIPISKKSVVTENFTSLPHVLVNNWDQVTEEFLNEQYLLIEEQNWKWEKIWFNYWQNKILTI